MANEKALFRTLNDGTEAGIGLDQAVDATTAASGKKGSVAFSFKDSSGNVILPQLTAAGKVPVDIGAAAGTPKKHWAANNGGSLTMVDLATLPSVTTGKTYNNIFAQVACQNEAEFELVYINDAGGTPVETIICTFMTGPGMYSDDIDPRTEMQISTVGGTGTQEIKIRGKNLHKVSRLVGTLSAIES